MSWDVCDLSMNRGWRMQEPEKWRFRVAQMWSFKICRAGLPQWLRIFLPMQGTWIRSLVREDSTCHRETKSALRYWTRALEPRSCNYWSPCTLEPMLCKREKPPQWEAHPPQPESSPCSAPLEKACTVKAWRSQKQKINKSAQSRPGAAKNKK